jgi:hypothetical protein
MSDRREEIKKAMKFMDDAETAEIESKQRIRKRESRANSSILAGKAGAMGEPIGGFYSTPQGPRDKEASKAFDAVQNYDESRAEDERTKVKMLAAKIKSLRANSK